jgi:hypothetical protein
MSEDEDDDFNRFNQNDDDEEEDSVHKEEEFVLPADTLVPVRPLKQADLNRIGTQYTKVDASRDASTMCLFLDVYIEVTTGVKQEGSTFLEDKLQDDLVNAVPFFNFGPSK